MELVERVLSEGTQQNYTPFDANGLHRRMWMHVKPMLADTSLWRCAAWPGSKVEGQPMRSVDVRAWGGGGQRPCPAAAASN